MRIAHSIASSFDLTSIRVYPAINSFASVKGPSVTNLLDQLLDISRQDEDLLELHFAPYNLSEMMRKIVADYLLILDGQGFTIEVDIPDRDVVIDINQSLIERAFRNNFMIMVTASAHVAVSFGANYRRDLLRCLIA